MLQCGRFLVLARRPWGNRKGGLHIGQRVIGRNVRFEVGYRGYPTCVDGLSEEDISLLLEPNSGFIVLENLGKDGSSLPEPSESELRSKRLDTIGIDRFLESLTPLAVPWLSQFEKSRNIGEKVRKRLLELKFEAQVAGSEVGKLGVSVAGEGGKSHEQVAEDLSGAGGAAIPSSSGGGDSGEKPEAGSGAGKEKAGSGEENQPPAEESPPSSSGGEEKAADGGNAESGGGSAESGEEVENPLNG